MRLIDADSIDCYNCIHRDIDDRHIWDHDNPCNNCTKNGGNEENFRRTYVPVAIPQWIKINCPNNPPPSFTDVLILSDAGEIFSANKHGGTWRSDDPGGGGYCHVNAKVTHWMHLPKPPKEETNAAE